MTPEEAKAKLKQRAEEQKSNQTTIAPNPAKVSLKWKMKSEEVAIEGGRKATVLGGGFFFQEKQEDGTWKSFEMPQKSFSVAVIDHTIVQIQNTEFVNGRPVRSFYSNEMRQSDSYTTPFILRIKEGDTKLKPVVDSYKSLKDTYGVKRMHVIYALSHKGNIVKIMLPYYSYSLGSESFKTSGYTLLDADRRSVSDGLGGMAECLLTFDGAIELSNGGTKFTAPKFEFKEKMNDEMIVQVAEAADIIDSWYAEMHASNIAYMDKLNGNIDPEAYQGESKHGSENQEVAASTTDVGDADDWDSDSIPF